MSTRPLPVAAKWGIRIVLLAMPLFAGLLIGRGRHIGLVLDHYLYGRAGNCTLSQSFESETLSRRQADGVDQLRAASRIVRQDEQFSLWNTPAGSYWIPSASGDAVLYDLSEQQRNIYGSGETGVHAGDIVLDAGANVGVFTRKALAAGARKVIAIEPAPENLECLRRNFEREIAEGRVVIYPKGVWNKDDVLRFSVDPSNSARDSFVRPIEHAQFIEVPLTTIDKLVQELGLPHVDFIKMDIEGAEQKAIAGARETIAKSHPRMALCVYHDRGDEVAIPQAVHEIAANYRVNQTCLCALDRIQPEVAFFY